ncbi:CobW family GTP-binding protein [Moraxella marmotae]|uniref:CobW family GTP-binding protein n=1 Tax=Moraxella marmotae TaxID=3344520 RepID=UPI0035F43F72
MQLNPITQTPTTIITGFLGAGKTTLINQLLTHKDAQPWALLINEFGKIGVDGDLITKDSTLAIKEVSGGCICCTSQLPLQIALVRLLAEHRPHRLIIEPTGLAHPDELLEQLSQPHWQTSLKLTAVICVLSAAQWQQDKYRNHDGYIAHVRHADAVVVNRLDCLERPDELMAWLNDISPTAQIFTDTIDAAAATKLLDMPHHTKTAKRQVPLTLIRPASQQMSKPSDDTDGTLPYRYHESMAGYQVGGWRLPDDWQFDSYELQKWLLARPNYLRIKGIIHTNEGWLALNITADSISISDSAPHSDTKIELIFDSKDSLSDEIWQDWDNQLMTLICADS